MSQAWRILVVDDEEDARKLIRLSLGDEYEIVEATNGLDVLEKIDDVEPDFIIMDIMMPLMDGYKATEAIRKTQKFQNIDVLFLTAKTDTESIKKSYAAGANLFLSKPCEPERLKKNIALFFKQSPPRQYEKRHTIEELQQREDERREARRASPHSRQAGDKHQRPRGADYPTPAPDHIIPPDEQSKEPPRNVSVATPLPSDIKPNVRPAGSTLKEPWRVMAIDSDPDICDMIRRTLGGAYHVNEAEDGLTAIEKIVLYEPDLLIVDALMPKLSAFQLVQMLRKSTKFMSLPIIVISARATHKDHEYAQQLGASDFLSKPLDPARLLASVGQHIREQPRMPKRHALAELKRMDEEKRRQDEEKTRQRQLKQDSVKIQEIFHEEE
ncbi:response regulator [Candidatus Sumerlaeota bacterium]|nr:response regulator [Candidatus Sumerlaeota bacterium]